MATTTKRKPRQAAVDEVRMDAQRQAERRLNEREKIDAAVDVLDANDRALVRRFAQALSNAGRRRTALAVLRAAVEVSECCGRVVVEGPVHERPIDG